MTATPAPSSSPTTPWTDSYRVPAQGRGAATLEAPVGRPTAAPPLHGGVLPANAATFGSFPARELIHAGFWRRLAAFVVDLILLTIVGLLVGFAIAFFLELTRKGGATVFADSAWPTAIGLVIGSLYNPLLESSAAQGSYGKRALGIMVTDLEGRPISFLRALGRNLGKWISGLLLCAGYLMIAFTERKQALHDMMASTLVVVGTPRGAR